MAQDTSGVVVAFISQRGISLRTLPDPLPREWYVPIPQDSASDLKTEPQWRLHLYVKADDRTYIEREERRR